MLCPNCNEEFFSGEVCPSCGVDVFLYKKILRISDDLYNKGLTLARNSDLTGAIEYLTKSVAINKNNVRARNLLGLVLFEIGHVGDALKHWVISQSLLKSNDNPAAQYISIAQESGRTLERLSDALSMYNQSLDYIRQKSDDLAIIQLKKAIEINPKFINALNLLALCFLIQNDYEKASKAVDRVLSMDIHNTIALNYYTVMHPQRTRPGSEIRNRRLNTPQVTQAPASQPMPGYTRIPTHDKKTNFHITEILSFIIGAGIVFAVLYGLVIPAIQRDKNRLEDELEIRIAEATQHYVEQIEQYSDDLETHERHINDMQATINELESRFSAQDRTNRVLNAYSLLSENRYQEAVDGVADISTSGLASDIVEMAVSIRTIAYPLLAREYYDAGVAADRTQDYETALVEFLKALEYIDVEADYYRNLIYYLAFLYSQNTEMLIQAREYLFYLTEVHPTFNERDVSRLLGEVEEAIGE